MCLKTQQCMTEQYEINFVGKISKQANKRMIIIPLDKHDITSKLEGSQVYVKIWPVYPDQIGEIKKSKK